MFHVSGTFTGRGCLWLPSFMLSRFIRVVASFRLHSFSWPNNIPLYEYARICPSSVDGHLSCFHSGLLWAMLLWTLCTRFWMDMCYHFSWVYTYKWNCWIIWLLCLIFWGTASLFSKVNTPLYIPPMNFSMSLPTFFFWPQIAHWVWSGHLVHFCIPSASKRTWHR